MPPTPNENEFDTPVSRSPLGSREPLPRSVPSAHSYEAPGRRAQRVDALLDAMVKREYVPSRLAWRIFAASVEHLPGRTKRHSGWRRMARSRVHTSVWGQMAMAASVALTFVAASWFVVLPGSTPDDGFAHHDVPMSEATVVPASIQAEPIQWWLVDSELEYMKEAWETTLPEFAGDFELMREDLGL